MYSCNGTSTARNMHVICMHARSEKYACWRAQRTSQVYRLFPYRQSKSVPNRFNTIDTAVCSGMADYLHEPVSILRLDSKVVCLVTGRVRYRHLDYRCC